PGGTCIFLIASCGDRAGPGGLSCACGITSFLGAGLSLAVRSRLTKIDNATSKAKKMPSRVFMESTPLDVYLDSRLTGSCKAADAMNNRADAKDSHERDTNVACHQTQRSD